MSAPDEIDIVQELGSQPIKRSEGVDEDVNILSQKKKVSNLLTSPYFKEELEHAVTDVLYSKSKNGNSIDSDIAKIISPFHQSNFQVLEAYGEMRGIQGLKASVGRVSPINDINVGDTTYPKTEKLLRCKIATLYRIVDLHGWNNSLNDHISVRLNKEHEHFLISPYGLLHHEISASKLIKVNMQGELIQEGATNLTSNPKNFQLYSAIYQSRPDIHCIVHVKTPDVLAVSCLESGILNLCTEALLLGDVVSHSCTGNMSSQKERKLLQKSLGPTSKVLLLRNNGMVTCGETVEEAFYLLNNAVHACITQIRAMCVMKSEKLHQINAQKQQKTEECTQGSQSALRWKIGEIEFEAIVRMLDNMGYRSGYPYKNPEMLKTKSKQQISGKENALQNSQLSSEDLEIICGNLRKVDSSGRWVNSPNMYTKVDTHENSPNVSVNGDHSPKTTARTKWLRSNSPSTAAGGQSMKTKPNMFVPTGTDPREVAATRNSIRGQAVKSKNTSGPQSQLLQSVAPKQNSSQITTASKGIIERGIEYSLVEAAGPPNPFSKISKKDIESYKKSLINSTSESSKVNGDDNCKEQNGVITEEADEHKTEDEVFVNGNGKEDQKETCENASKEDSDKVSEESLKKAQVKASKQNKPATKTTRVSFQTAISANENPDIGNFHPPKNEKNANSEPATSAKKKKKRPLSFLKKGKKQK